STRLSLSACRSSSVVVVSNAPQVEAVQCKGCFLAGKLATLGIAVNFCQETLRLPYVMESGKRDALIRFPTYTSALSGNGESAQPGARLFLELVFFRGALDRRGRGVAA